MQHLVKHKKRVRRDARVDLVGLVKEIVAHFIGTGKDGLSAKIKAQMKPGEVVEGDLFFGRLDRSSSTRVNTRRVLQDFLDEKITMPQMVKMCSIGVTQAKQFYSAADWKKRHSVGPGTPSLDVCRRPGYEPDLVAVLKSLSELLAAEQKQTDAAGR